MCALLSMADQKVDDKPGASAGHSGSVLASADNRENGEVHTITTESDHSDDDLYDDTVVGPWTPADTSGSGYLEPVDSSIKSGDNANEYEYDEINSDDVYEVLPGNLNDRSKKKKKGIKAFFMKLFPKCGKGNKRRPPSLPYVAACNKEVATPSSAEGLEPTNGNKCPPVPTGRRDTGDNEDYYNDCDSPEDGDITVNECRLLIPDTASGTDARIEDSSEEYGGGNFIENEDELLYDYVDYNYHSVHNSETDRLQRAFSTSPTNEVATPSSVEGLEPNNENTCPPVPTGRRDTGDNEDYYNDCDAPEDGGTAANEGRFLTPDIASGTDAGIEDSCEKYGEGTSLEYEDELLYDDVECNFHSVRDSETDRSQREFSTSPTNGDSPSLKRTSQTHNHTSETSTEETTNRVETEVPCAGFIEEESAEPDSLGSLENMLYNAEVASSSAIASSCALESVVIPPESFEVAPVKEKCIESFEKISCYHRLLENINEVHPVHGVLGPFVDYRNPSVVEAYQACLETLDEVKKWICENHEEFAGEIIGTGSYHDGTKIGKANEFDFLFQLRNTSFQMQLDNRRNLTFKVMPDCFPNGAFSEICEEVGGRRCLVSDRFYRAFAGHVNAALATIELPSKMRHAGFCSPRFSGVRKCGPAATILIYFQHREDEEVLITIDVSPALPVSLCDIQQNVNIRWPLPVSDQLNENETAQLHLIPGDRRLSWRLTTATLEANYMKKNLAPDGKVRRSIQVVKGLLEKHLTVRLEVTEREKAKRKLCMIRFAEKHLKEGTLLQHIHHLVRQKKFREMLLLHQACVGVLKSAPRNMVPDMERVEDILREEMLHGWGLVDPITLSLANEMSQPCISTKSCVVKYAVLDLFFDGSLFDNDHSPPSLLLIHTVMQHSTNEEVLHSILRTDIKTKNISAYAERSVPNMTKSDWIELHNDLCSKLLDKIQDLNAKRSIGSDKATSVPVVTNRQATDAGTSDAKPKLERRHAQPTADCANNGVSMTRRESNGSWSRYGGHAMAIPRFRDNLQQQFADVREAIHYNSSNVNPERTTRLHSASSPPPAFNEVHATVPTVCGSSHVNLECTSRHSTCPTCYNNSAVPRSCGCSGGTIRVHAMCSPHCTRQATPVCQIQNYCDFCRGMELGQRLYSMTLHGNHFHGESMSPINFRNAPSTDNNTNPHGVNHPAGLPATVFHEDLSQSFTAGHPHHRFRRTQTLPPSRRRHFARGESGTRTPYPHNTAFMENRAAAAVREPGVVYGTDMLDCDSPMSAYRRKNEPCQEDMTEGLAVPSYNCHGNVERHSTHFMSGTRTECHRVRSNRSMSGAVPDTLHSRQASSSSQGPNVMAL